MNSWCGHLLNDQFLSAYAFLIWEIKAGFALQGCFDNNKMYSKYKNQCIISLGVQMQLHMMVRMVVTMMVMMEIVL